MASRTLALSSVLLLLLFSARSGSSSRSFSDRDQDRIRKELASIDRLVARRKSEQLERVSHYSWSNFSFTLALHPSACRGGNDCCRPDNRCRLGEGDCDRDSDCLAGLVCNNQLNNCGDLGIPGLAWKTLSVEGANFSPSDDCCTYPQEIIDYLREYGFPDKE